MVGGRVPRDPVAIVTKTRVGPWLATLILLGVLAWAEVAVGSIYRSLTHEACRHLLITMENCFETQRVAIAYIAAIRGSLLIIASIMLMWIWKGFRRETPRA